MFFFLENTNLDYSFLDSSASLLWNNCTDTINLLSNKAVQATDNFERLAQDFVIFYKVFCRFTILIRFCMNKKRCGQSQRSVARKGFQSSIFGLKMEEQCVKKCEQALNAQSRP